MPIRRLPLLLLTLIAAALVVAGCGGDDEASTDTDVDKLLQDTFSGDKQVDSGRLDLSVRIEAQGASAGGAQLQGPVNVRLEGPFQGQGEGELPQFSFNASLQGAGQDLQAGVTSTGDKGFVKFQNADYVVSNEVFQQFRTGWEESQKQSEGSDDSLASLGIDPRKWLTNARNAGEAKVGDTDTIKITGDVDVPKLLDDLNAALQRARSLGGQAGQGLPEQLTDEQKRQAEEAIKSLNVEIYTGKEDTILRRIVVDLGVEQGAEGGTMRFDLQLLDLNEDQEISEPENPKPFDELLGNVGGLLGGSAPSGSGSGGAAGSQNLEEYSKCIEDAGSDADKARECADLLTP